MNQDKDPLVEWNRLNISNAERDLGKAFYLGILSGSEPVDRFSSWLLAGIAGTAALFITGVASVLPYLSELGFKQCEAILIVAGLFGLLAKQRALSVKIALEQDRVLIQTMLPVFDKHDDEEEKIQELAEKRGISLNTDINFDRVVQDFISVFPAFMHRHLNQRYQRGIAYPNSALRDATRGFLYQLLFSGLQTAFFVVFVGVAVLHASAI